MPPEFRRVFDDPGADQHVEIPLVFPPRGELLRKPGTREVLEDDEPVGEEPRRPPVPERGGGAQREKMGEHVLHLVHQVDPQVVVFDPGVDMHPADHELAGDLAEIGGHLRIAGVVRGLLLGPVGEGMGGGCDDGGAVLAHDLR